MSPLPLPLLLLVLPLLPLAAAPAAQTYIVLTRPALKPARFPTHQSWYASALRSLPDRVGPAHAAHTYSSALHGFSAPLTPSQASSLRSLPFVLAVLPDRAHQLQTTRSPRFLGLGSRNSVLMAGSGEGADAVIAVLDSGVDPRHRSFGDGGIGPVPARWKGGCEVGPAFGAGSCNRKLIGALSFSAGFKAAASGGNTTTDIMSPFDTDGHGTHTASTAAGRPARNASLFGYAAGTASGVAPSARLAVYKVCWSSGCFDSDILAAIDRAVDDGADVISLSVGAGPTPYQLDPIAIAAFGAVARGVFVSASAGNGGPGEMTATNIAPWIATVGAGSIDRDFPADIVLGDGTIISGTSLYVGPTDDRYFPLVHAGNASSSKPGYSSSAPFCMRGSLDPEAARGKVVLCERGAVARAEKGLVVKEAGGAGVIVANQPIDGEGVIPDAHLIPAVGIGAKEGSSIRSYLANQRDPRVKLVFRGTRLDVRPAPVVAAFSGRGPNAESPHIVKPDILAPGVSILAAWTGEAGPTGLAADTRKTEFNILSGTSMACPHVSGIAALLKAAHPDWSPAAVKSAMMTSASVTDNLGREITDETNGIASTGWAVGSGHVKPEKAVDPGLIYDITVDDYVNFLCSSNYSKKDIDTIARRSVDCPKNSTTAPWDLNYPSISVMFEQSGTEKHEATVHRTVTNVGEETAVYTVSIKNPVGAAMDVQPQKLSFSKKGQKLGFVVRVSGESVVGLRKGSSRTEFGSVVWCSGKHVVRSPVAVTWQQSY